MPEQSPLTLGLVPPQLRAMAPATRAMTQHQALTLIETLVKWVGQKVPKLKVDITKSTTSMTIYVEMTGGSST